MILSVVIPQYKEKEETIKPLLDSIMGQKDIDFKEIEVLIINDGTDVKLSEEFLAEYKKLNIGYYHLKSNVGPGQARQAGADLAKGEYITFCDDDDVFYRYSVFAEYFSCIEKYHPATIYSNWIMEKLEDGKLVEQIIDVSTESTWTHGKLFASKFLKDYDIRFCNIARFNEDISFISIVNAYLSIKLPGYAYNQVTIKTPTYIWKYNKASASRSSGKFMIEQCDSYMVAMHWALEKYAKAVPKLVPLMVARLLLWGYFAMHYYYAYLTREQKVVIVNKTFELLREYWVEYTTISDEMMEIACKYVQKSYPKYTYNEEQYRVWLKDIVKAFADKCL